MINQILNYLAGNLVAREQSVCFSTPPGLVEHSSNRALKAFIDCAKQVDFGKRLLDVVLLKQPLLLKDGETLAQFECCLSVMSDGSYNFLVCKIDETLVLVAQHVSSADFIYVPEFNLMAKICHINDELAASALSRFNTALLGFCESYRPSVKPGFGGVIASHGRPAHFFYDCALGAQTVYEQFSYSAPLPVYQIAGGDFANLASIFGERYFTSKGSVSFAEINKLAQQQLLFIKLGGNYAYGTPELKALLERFDKLFLNTAGSTEPLLLQQLKQYKAAGYFLLWHGITTDKRKWMEQESAIIAFVEALQLSNKKVCLLVDGWTSPLSVTAYDNTQITNDNEVYQRIKFALPAAVPCLSLIGQPPAVKAAVAGMIDFHVSNGGTGSLYVSRVAKKPGVLHIANRSKTMTRQSLHFNSLFVPEHYVVDLPPEGLDRDDYISYSIPSTVFVPFAFSVLTQHKTPNKLFLSKVAGCNISDQGLQFVSYGNDPNLLFYFSPELFASETPLKLVFKIATALPLANLKGKLYLDYGTGFNEEQILRGQYSADGTIVFTIMQPKALKNFRYDPFDCVGAFSLEAAEVLS